MKKSTTTNYLLIDLGNTCIKACIMHNKTLSHFVTERNYVSFTTIYKKLKTKRIDKVIFLSSTNPTLENKVLKQVKRYCSNIKKIVKSDFKGLLDLSNIKKNVVVGNDILLSAYYTSTRRKKGASLCLGTVFYLVIVNKNKFLSVDLIPNVMIGLEQVPNLTSIPRNLIPTVFDKNIGLNTPDAFASGARNMMEGYLDFVCKKYKLSRKHIFICGGGSYRYQVLSKKYTFVSHASLRSIAILAIKKKW